MKKTLALFFAFLCALALSLPAAAAEGGAKKPASFTAHVAGVNDHGSLFLDLTGDGMRARSDIAFDDLVTVTLNGDTFDYVIVNSDDD